MMKTRLYGLLALVLCAMMVAAPVAAMGAVTNRLVYFSQEAANAGKLIEVEKNDILLDSVVMGYEFDVDGAASGVQAKIEYLSIDENGLPTTKITEIGKWETSETIAPADRTGWLIRKIDKNNTSTSFTLTAKAASVDILGSSHIKDTDYYAYAFSYPFEDVTDKLFEAGIEKLSKIKSFTYLYGIPYEINAYSKIHNDQALREADPSEITFPVEVTFTDERLKGVTTGWLIGQKSDGTYDDLQEIRINNGTWTATLYHFSPYMVLYGDESGTIIPGGPGNAIPAPAEPAAPNIPQTGDNSQLALWFALAALSLAGAVLILRRRKA